jgi:hypothetical protein
VFYCYFRIVITTLLILHIQMQTITIDIINDKAMNLLKDMELLKLIRLREVQKLNQSNWASKYKGAITKQVLSDVDDQLKELRNEWE